MLKEKKINLKFYLSFKIFCDGENVVSTSPVWVLGPRSRFGLLLKNKKVKREGTLPSPSLGLSVAYWAGVTSLPPLGCPPPRRPHCEPHEGNLLVIKDGTWAAPSSLQTLLVEQGLLRLSWTGSLRS